MSNDTVHAVFVMLAEVEQSQRKGEELIRVIFWLVALDVFALAFLIAIFTLLISRGFWL